MPTIAISAISQYVEESVFKVAPKLKSLDIQQTLSLKFSSCPTETQKDVKKKESTQFNC